MRRRTIRIASSLLVAAAVVVGPARAHRCVGDCDGSDTISIAELVNGVRILLNQVDLDTCFQFDADLDNRVSVNELLVAVNNAFSFCGHGVPPESESLASGP